MAARPPALEIDAVTQEFSLRHEKTLRGLFVTKVLRRHPTKQTFTALDNLSFDIQAGSTVGLIGHNGSGKSTLLKIIGGVLTPTKGEVRRRGSLAALLELGAGFHHDLTGRENVFLNAEVLGIPRDVAKQRFDEIVEFSGVGQFIDTPMKFYSSGMFVRLGFAVAVFAEPQILLVDEVLAVGDEAFQRKCLDVVRRFQQEGRTIVLVTHDMRQVEDFCDRAILLEGGTVIEDGDPTEVVRAFRRALQKGPAQAAPPLRVEDVRVDCFPHREGHVRLVVHAELEGDVSAPGHLCATVLTHNGTPIIELTTVETALSGRTRATVIHDYLPLTAGEYRVLVTAVGGQPDRLWRSERSCPFTVEGNSQASGAPLRYAAQLRLDVR